MSQQIPERIPGGAVDLSHLVSRGAGGPAGTDGSGSAAGASAAQPGQTVDIPAVVFELTDQTFEQAMQLSSVVPVVVELTQPGIPEDEALARVTRESEGRAALAKVDVTASPGLAQAFQVQSVPSVVALIAGRPVPLFQGTAPEQQLRELFAQLAQLAAQQGVVGRVNAPDLGVDGAGKDTGVDPAAPAINPAHAEALEALERGDFAAAIEAYEHVLLKAPADHEAHAALTQVRLLHRLDGLDAETIREAAAADPDDLEAQLRVADLDVSGGHVEDAFLRLLERFAASSEDDVRTKVRERLLELFEVVGQADPRVAAARSRLANLLY